MFKTAPRYLSGVSVFYGDDITKRTVEGEIAFIVGQSKKGTRLPLQLRSVEHAVPIYGVDSPLMKALHQFWDGYIDSPRAQNIRLVTMRVGGIPARLETSYGLIIETVDAYDGIENELFIYVDNSSAAKANVKVWDTNMALVYDGLAGVDANYIKVISQPDGLGGVSAKYGEDIENNPTAKPTSLAAFKDLDFKNVTITGTPAVASSSLNGSTVAGPVSFINVTGLTVDEANLIPAKGFVRLSQKVAAVTLTAVYEYSAADDTNATTTGVKLTLVNAIADNSWGIVSGSITGVTWIQSTLVKGDSQIGSSITVQQKYELFRNALLEIEQFTPDYIIPGGVLFDETSDFTKTYSPSTLVAKDVLTHSVANTVLGVKAAETWLPAHTVEVDGGVTYKMGAVDTKFQDELTYTAKTLIDNETDGIIDEYDLTIEIPTFAIDTAPTINTASVATIYSTYRTATSVSSLAQTTAITNFIAGLTAPAGADATKVTALEAVVTAFIAANTTLTGDLTTPTEAHALAQKTAFNALATEVALVHDWTDAAADTAYATVKTNVALQNIAVNAAWTTAQTTDDGLSPMTIKLVVDPSPTAVTGLTKLRNQGHLLFGSTVIRYRKVTIADNVATLDLLDPINDIAIASGDFAAGDICTKIIGICTKDTFAASSTWDDPNTPREIGLGYVKETDTGGKYEFHWTADGEPAPEHGLAHFGYLFANFCNSAAIGYNTPLCAMNTTLPTTFERSDIVNWIGNYPKYKFVAGNGTIIEDVATNGKGLLGNPVLAGSVKYKRSYMNNKTDGVYVDPAYGLLLTDEEYIDGHEIKDTYFKVIDLGKFMIVGCGLLTFNNRASQVPYVDTCGIYALGLLAGKGKDQGISFSQIGTSSNVSVGVVVHRKYYNDLANLGYIVITREKGLGWVINNGNSVSRSDSGYVLISTTRIVKEVIEGKRAALAGFIGKALNRYSYEAAKTRIADGFRKDVQNGLLNGYTFDLQIEDAGQAIGKLYLKCSINPPFELTQVDIDTVIDRAVTSVTG